ncbi:hypothetical protein FF38_04184 [Lucilia cuprina]|uniref:Endonuclease/exonuclease/phosphatase domain-containing protein n=1 Tax=Lucilia cuprina TaxID=7375 RepID=A0A0L0BVK6_LUCCU|nr:hypothetical protein FF38_04184 [Lucilia cuprina]
MSATSLPSGDKNVPHVPPCAKEESSTLMSGSSSAPPPTLEKSSNSMSGSSSVPANPQRHKTPSRRAFRRAAERIVERHGAKPNNALSKDEKSSLEWAKNKLSSLIGLSVRSNSDGAISQDKWGIIRQRMLGVYWNILKENPGPAPQNDDADWFQVAEVDDTLLDSDPEDVDVTVVYDPDFGDGEGEELILVQEPWTHHGKVRGLSIKGYKLLYANCSGNIRSCILAKSYLNIFILSDYSDEDTVAADWESGNSIIWLLSSYMAHDHGDQPPNRLVRDIVCEADRRHIPLIMGADANAHHTVWVIANRRKVLDITVVNATNIDLIQGWKVSNECSFSDHCFIEFDIVVQAKIIEPFLNRRKTNWEVHKATLNDILPTVPTIESRSDIDLAVNWISSSISEQGVKSPLINLPTPPADDQNV